MYGTTITPTVIHTFNIKLMNTVHLTKYAQHNSQSFCPHFSIPIFILHIFHHARNPNPTDDQFPLDELLLDDEGFFPPYLCFYHKCEEH